MVAHTCYQRALAADLRATTAIYKTLGPVPLHPVQCFWCKLARHGSFCGRCVSDTSSVQGGILGPVLGSAVWEAFSLGYIPPCELAGARMHVWCVKAWPLLMPCTAMTAMVWSGEPAGSDGFVCFGVLPLLAYFCAGAGDAGYQVISRSLGEGGFCSRQSGVVLNSHGRCFRLLAAVDSPHSHRVLLAAVDPWAASRESTCACTLLAQAKNCVPVLARKDQVVMLPSGVPVAESAHLGNTIVPGASLL